MIVQPSSPLGGAGESATIDSLTDPSTSASALARRGIFVFPLWPTEADGSCGCHVRDCKSPGKHPLGVLVPHGPKEATTDPSVIEQWWAPWPDANVGVATGGGSGLVVLDVDGEVGKISLAGLVTRYGPLPSTWTVQTGRGRHLYFAHPGRWVKNSVGRLGLKLDIRGDGGYVVAPPSLHDSGRRYAWVEGLGPDGLPLAALPAWVLELVVEDSKTLRPPHAHRVATSLGPDDMIIEGSRNTTLASLAGTMRRRGFTGPAILAALLEENRLRCRPPLSEDEVGKIARSIARYEPSALVLARPENRQTGRRRPRFAGFELRGGKAVPR